MTNAEKVAKAFHESYERQAPDYGYVTREADYGYVTRQEIAKPWEDVLPSNKNLMIAVCLDLLKRKVISINENS